VVVIVDEDLDPPPLMGIHRCLLLCSALKLFSDGAGASPPCVLPISRLLPLRVSCNMSGTCQESDDARADASTSSAASLISLDLAEPVVPGAGLVDSHDLDVI
jgi:hypothetical protein